MFVNFSKSKETKKLDTSERNLNVVETNKNSNPPKCQYMMIHLLIATQILPMEMNGI